VDLPRRSTLAAAVLVVLLVALLFFFIVSNGIALFTASHVTFEQRPQHQLEPRTPAPKPPLGSCLSSPARSA